MNVGRESLFRLVGADSQDGANGGTAETCGLSPVWWAAAPQLHALDVAG